MSCYLGEELVTDLSSTKFKDYTKTDWVMYFISRYGQIDGSYHKSWVLDQIARILHDTKVIVKIAKWDSGYTEYREELAEPSEEYLNWVEYMKDNGNYDYYEGIAP